MATDVNHPQPKPNWNDALSRELAQRLEELQDFTHKHRARIDNAEAVLIAQLEQLVAESQGSHGEGTKHPPGSAEVRTLAKRRRKLEQAYDELKSRRARTREQRHRLAKRLKKFRAEREHPPPAAGGNHGELQQEFNDLHDRYKMSIDELRELKHRCAELESHAASHAGPASAGKAAPSIGAFDWEAQKRRMMEAMDSDFDDSEPQSHRDKLTVDETIRVTDSIVAEKDREIAELREQLEARTVEVITPAGPSAETTEILDADEIIRQERERLTQLEEELQEKLRLAEIELSQARAKIARERAELAEQRRILDEERMVLESKEAGDSAADQRNSAKGRWLARLGLQEPKQE